MRASLLFVILLFACPCLATTWDVRNDWSDASNPNGVWSYREGGNALPHVAAWQAGLGYAQPAWSVGENAPSEYLPAWFKATGTASGLDWVVGDVVVHTTDPANGPSQGNAILKWTSPITATVQMVGSIWLTRDIGRSVAWSLLRNGTPFTGGSVFSGDSFNRNNPMSLGDGTGGAGVMGNIPVSTGDTIELLLVTTSGNALGDLVGINLKISDDVTGIGDEPPLSRRFVLHNPVPNPFNPSTSIAFDVPVGGADVSIIIYDSTGRRVRTLAGDHRDAGTHRVTWNGVDDRGSRVASGVYLCRVRAGAFNETRKLSLVK